MSYFDILPTDVQSYVLELKYALETKDLQSFAEDFDMLVIRCNKVSTSTYDGLRHERKHHRYDSLIHLTYKPTNKSVITTYGFGAYEDEDPQPKKLHVIHGICFDAFYLKDGDWAFYRDDNGRWQKDFSYQRYCESGEGSEMTYKQFIRWKVQVKKTELMLGQAFEKFIMCNDHL